jgi:site-specific DNA-methyltransferase (adenine-specific)
MKQVRGITGGSQVVRNGGLTPSDERDAKSAGRFAAGKVQPDRKGYSDESGQETVEDWECAPGCPVRVLDEQSGEGKGTIRQPTGNPIYPTDGSVAWNSNSVMDNTVRGYSDSGGAARFFHNFEPEYDAPFFYTGKITSGERKRDLEEEGLINKHPTTKTLKLMTFLVRLITPPGGTVLDPFAGSGSTLVAAVQNGFRFIGIEQDPEYIEIAKGRLGKAVEREVEDQNQRDMFDELFGDSHG